jgi:uracil-DNA glycosylase
MSSARTPTDLRAIAVFYQEAGVDAVLADAPVDRFAEPATPSVAAAVAVAEVSPPDEADEPDASEGWTLYQRAVTPSRPRAVMPSTTAPPPAPLSPDTAIMAAREAARSAASLDELQAILAGFEGCGLRLTAKRLVFADGNPRARVMFVGEAPGREEDLEGLPFVGRSGRLLDRMMAAIGLDRTSAYIANVIPWRPPGNRTPTPQESQICLPFIKRQIELADPDILVCLGSPAAQALLGTGQGIRRARGHWHAYHTGTREIRAIASFHPAYLLRTPLEKRLAWRDFLSIRAALDAPATRTDAPAR